MFQKIAFLLKKNRSNVWCRNLWISEERSFLEFIWINCAKKFFYCWELSWDERNLKFDALSESRCGTKNLNNGNNILVTLLITFKKSSDNMIIVKKQVCSLINLNLSISAHFINFMIVAKKSKCALGDFR